MTTPKRCRGEREKRERREERGERREERGEREREREGVEVVYYETG